MTAGSNEEATRLADMLVGANARSLRSNPAAMESVYRWKGKIDRQAEVLLIAKTLKLTRFAELERHMREIHSYETPEIVAIPN